MSGVPPISKLYECCHLPSPLCVAQFVKHTLSFQSIRIVVDMKVAITTGLFMGVAVAHSGVWNVEVDGNKYFHHINLI